MKLMPANFDLLNEDKESVTTENKINAVTPEEVEVKALNNPTLEEAQKNIADVAIAREKLDEINAAITQGQYQENESEGTNLANYWLSKAKLESLEDDFNNNDYKLDLDPGVWDVVSGAISDAAAKDGPEAAEELSYKYASAIQLSKMLGLTMEEAMASLDDTVHTYYGDEYKDYKSKYKAIKDSFTLGVNTLRETKLGNKLQELEATGDTEGAQQVWDIINKLDEYSNSLQDALPRKWTTEAMKNAMQTLPYTAAVAAPSILAGIVAPGLGTIAGFAAGFDVTYGTEYIELRKAGVDPKVAQGVAALSSAGQAAVEQMLGTIANTSGKAAASIGKNALKNTNLEKGMDKAAAEISEALFKRFHFGELGYKAIARGLMEYGENALEEGAEEAVQSFISAGGKYLAQYLSENDIDVPDAQEIWEQACQEAKGAILGSLILGIPNAGFSAKATINDFNAVKQEAIKSDSKEDFIKTMQKSQDENSVNAPGANVFEGMSQDAIKEAAGKVYDSQTKARNERESELTKKYNELYTTEEGIETLKTDEETGETEEAGKEYRTESGELYTQDDIKEIDENGNQHGTYQAGNKDTGKNYGYIKYTINNDEGTVTIDSYKMAEHRESLRKELFEDFADQYSDYDIKWNPNQSDSIALRDSFIAANPRGKEAGLNYYTKEEDKELTKARVEVARQIRNNFNFKTDREVYTAVAVFEAFAQGQEQNLKDFFNNTFNGQIFGDKAILEEAARRQNAVDANGNILAKGGININDDIKDSIKAVIYTSDKSDLSTWMHELTHLWRKMLTGEQLEKLNQAMGITDGKWTTELDEKLAELAEKAYGMGKVENSELKGLLSNIADILQNLKEFIERLVNYLSARGEINPELLEQFNTMLKGDDNLMAKAARATKEADTQKTQEEINQREEQSKKQTQQEQTQKDLNSKKEAMIRTDETSELASAVQQTEEVIKSNEASIGEKTEAVINESKTLKQIGEEQSFDDTIDLFQLMGRSVISQDPKLSQSFMQFIKMKKAGTYTNADIKKATGWEQDNYGNVWHEEDNLHFKSEQVQQDIEGLLKDGEKYKNAIITLKPLSEIISDNEAMLYPGMKDSTLYLMNLEGNQLDAVYVPGSNAIVINTTRVKDGWSFMRSLTNGIQQAILKNEGMLDVDTTILQDLITQNARAITQLKKAGQQIDQAILEEVKNLFTEYLASPVGRLSYEVSQRYAKNEKPSTLFFNPATQAMQFQILGEKGATNLDKAEEVTTRIDNLNIAKQMEAAGKDAKTIRLATGWEKGKDNRWKYEISDNYKLANNKYTNSTIKRILESIKELEEEIKRHENNEESEELKAIKQKKIDDMKARGLLSKDYDPDSEINAKRQELSAKKRSIKYLEIKNKNESIISLIQNGANKYNTWDSKGWYALSDIIENKELFEAYPELKETNILFINNQPGYTKGSFVVDKKEIIVYPAGATSYKEFINTIIHEIQHNIQDIEGFANGGSDGDFIIDKKNVDYQKYLYDHYTQRAEELKKQIDKEINIDEYLKNSMQAVAKNEKTIDEHFTQLDDLRKGHELYFSYENYLRHAQEANEAYQKASTIDISKYLNISNKEKYIEYRQSLDYEELVKLEKIEELEGVNQDKAINSLNPTELDHWYTLEELKKAAETNEVRVEPYEAYKRIAGETEARNVQSRQGLSIDQRIETLLADTEDVAREDQIILDGMLFQTMNDNEKTIDLTNELNVMEGFTKDEVKELVKELVNQLIDKKFTSSDGKNLTVSKENIGHIKNTSMILKGKKHRIHAVTIWKFEKLIENSLEKIEPQVVDLQHNTRKKTLEHKQQVEKYHYFDVPVKIEESLYNVRIVAEKLKNDTIKNLYVYSVSEKKEESPITQSVLKGTPHADNLSNTIDNVNSLQMQTDVKDMYAIHNLRPDALRHVLKMGGLANPSMAVTDLAHSFSNFGGISLIPSPKILTKEGKNAGTYGADIYSPRYPSVKKTITDTGRKAIKDIFKAVDNEKFKNELINRTIESFEESRKPDFNWTVLPIEYLLEKGTKDFIKYEKSNFSDDIKERVKALGPTSDVMEEETAKVIFEIFKELKIGDWENYLKSNEEKLANATTDKQKAYFKDHIETAKEILENAYEDINSSIDPKTGRLNFYVADNLLYSIKKDIKAEKGVDLYETKTNAREIVKDYPDFLKWADEKYASVEMDEKLFNGFTPSGNRRYLAHTLENVSKLMKAEGLRGGEGFSYGLGSTRAKFTPKFTTLQQIKKAKERLLTKEEFEEVKKEYEEQYNEIISKLAKDDGYDAGAARFEEAFTTRGVDPVQYLEDTYNLYISEDFAEEMQDFALKLKEMPTEYFETKFTRPVYLNEFEAAIIPSNLDEDLKKALIDNGLKIKEYNQDEDQGNQQRQAIEELAKESDLLFQTAYHGTAADFDKFNTDFIDSGEGSQSFGYGLYFTQDIDIAKDYARRQAIDKLELDSNDDLKTYYSKKIAQAMLENRYLNFEDEQLNLDRYYQKIYNDRIASLENRDDLTDEEKNIKYEEYTSATNKIRDAIKNITFEDIKKQAKRNLYTVDIPGDNLLNWESLVEKDLFDKIDKALNKLDDFYPDIETKAGYYPWNMYKEKFYNGELKPTGEDLYNYLKNVLRSDKKASMLLESIGYKGISYPAGTNFGYEGDARNYVIFNDKDVSIVDHIQFQTEQDLLNDAATFDSWAEFMEYCETFGGDAIPSGADATFYENLWSRAHQITSSEEALTQEKEAGIEGDQEEDSESQDPIAIDALFTTALKSRSGMLEDFLYKIEEIKAEDYIEAVDEEEQEQNEKLRVLKDYISKYVKHATVKSYAKGVYNGKKLDEIAVNKIAKTIGNSARAYRALYANIMDDPAWQVRKEDTVEAKIEKNKEELKKLTGLESDINIDVLSAEERTKAAKKLENEILKAKVKTGEILAAADYDSLIKGYQAEIDAKQNELEKATNDYQDTLNSITDYQQRDIVKLYEELLKEKAKYDKKSTTPAKHAESALKTGERYKSGVYADEVGTYNAIYRRYKDAVKLAKVTEEVKYAQQLLEKQAELKADVKDKKQQQAAIQDLKNLRKRLVKRTMRRVDFKNIDYDHARIIIAIQRLFEPNLEGGVNKWIGTEGKYARQVWSEYYTDEKARSKIRGELNFNGSKMARELINLLESTKSEADFSAWTNKQRQAIYKLLPKEDWVKELRLAELDKEREEAIQLPLTPRTYRKDIIEDGKRKTVELTRLEPSEELAKEIRQVIGDDMYTDLVIKDFAEWTTHDMEKFARKIDDYYVEGKQLLDAKKKARKQVAQELRDQILKQVLNTGIVINPDDPEDVKERKQRQIDKKLGYTDQIKGTAADSYKRKNFFNNVLHGYFDANVRRVARILDNLGEGVNTNLLYWAENNSYINEDNAKSRRYDKINAAMEAAGVKVADLYKKVNIDNFDDTGRTVTLSVDELLYYYQAQFDDKSRDAVAYGCMMDVKDRAKYQEADRAYFEALSQAGDDAIDALIKGDENAREEAIMKKIDLIKEGGIKGQYEQIKKEHPEYTEARIRKEIHLKPVGSEAYKVECNARYEKVLKAANKLLQENPGLKAFKDAIAEDYATEFDRLNRTSVEVFNSPVARVENYVPLVRLSLAGDTNEARVKADLLAQTAEAGSKAGVDKGMTQKRINIGALNQMPVEAGLYKTWAEQVERTEHFIAYSDYVRLLRDVYGSKDATAMMQWIESRYGNGMKTYIKDYINEVANPEAGKVRSSIDSFVRAMRGRTAPAYLSWKMSSILKQAVTSPMPYMQFIDPVTYIKSVFKYIAHPIATEEAIKNKSTFMKNRKFDPIADVINEEMNKQNNPKVISLWNRFSNIGMQGLEFIDWACVAPGWQAIYEREYKKLTKEAEDKYQSQLKQAQEDTPLWNARSNEELDLLAREGVMTAEEIEQAAINTADDAVRLSQPSNRITDISPLFKTKGTGNEIVKALLQFTMSLNVIWQNIRYDLPYAVKNRQYKQAVGMIAGYSIAGIGLQMLAGNVSTGSDDDDEKVKELIYGATTQFTDAIPIIGSSISAMDEKLITGKSQFTSGADLFPTLTKVIQGTTAAGSGDWDKAAKRYGEAVGMTIGAPVSGIKEVMAAFGLDDDTEGIELHPEAFLGQR